MCNQDILNGEDVECIISGEPPFALFPFRGDLTNNDADEMEWGEFLDAASGVFSRIPLMPTLGITMVLCIRTFALPDNGPPGLEQEFYSFDYGNAHFVVLNSNNNCNEKPNNGCIRICK